MSDRTETDRWITFRRGQQILGDVSYLALDRLVREGRLSVRRVPGTHPRLRQREVENLAARSIHEATLVHVETP